MGKHQKFLYFVKCERRYHYVNIIQMSQLKGDLWTFERAAIFPVRNVTIPAALCASIIGRWSAFVTSGRYTTCGRTRVIVLHLFTIVDARIPGSRANICVQSKSGMLRSRCASNAKRNFQCVGNKFKFCAKQMKAN